MRVWTIPELERVWYLVQQLDRIALDARHCQDARPILNNILEAQAVIRRLEDAIDDLDLAELRRRLPKKTV
jgi:hypothetical protein